jgi:hypothetical protein
MMNGLDHFKFIVLIFGGAATILGTIAIIIGAVMKKEAGNIKPPCQKEFDAIKLDLNSVESGARERHDKILRMEIRFEEILNRIEKLERVIEENIRLTNQIYADMPKRLPNGRTSKSRK